MSVEECPGCGAPRPANADFCANPSCRGYLAWEQPPAAPDAPSSTPNSSPSEPDAHTSTVEVQPAAIAVVSLLGDDTAAKTPSVAAGGQISLTALVRNQSEIVDSYRMSVEQLESAEWWTIEPETVNLLPVDTGERYEQEILVLLHPPRAPRATAKCWDILIAAYSVAHKQRAASVSTSFVIERYEQIEIEVLSNPAPSHRSSFMRVKLTNRSNYPVTATVSGLVEKDLARLSFEPAEMKLKPAQSRPVDVTVTPVRRQLIGGDVEHKLTLDARILGEPGDDGDEQEDKPSSCSTVFTQRSWLPSWTPRLAGALLALAIAGVAFYILTRPKLVRVPEVRGEYITEARREIDHGDLLSDDEKVETTSLKLVRAHGSSEPAVPVRVGDVYEEKPKAGTYVKRGTTIKLYTDTELGPARVPDLYDLPVELAERELSAAGFAIGDIEPYPPPKGDVIVSQVPAKDEQIAQDKEAVNVKMGQLAAVPDVIGQTPAAATAKLSAAGLVLGTVSPEKARPSEVILAQSPLANKVELLGVRVNVVLGEAVPKLAGLNLLAARRALAASGFPNPTLTPKSAPDTDIVVRQSPAPGIVATGSTHVTLAVAPPSSARQKTKKRAKAKSAGETGRPTNAESPTSAEPSTTAEPPTTAKSQSQVASSGLSSTGGVSPEPAPGPHSRPARSPAEPHRSER